MNDDVARGVDLMKKLTLMTMVVLVSLLTLSAVAMAEPRTGGPLPIWRATR